MRGEKDNAHLEAVRNLTEKTLREAIGDAEDVAILDAPNQRNIGDSLIWEGEIAYLERMGKRVRYVSDLRGYDRADLMRRLPKGGVVLLHGGGNFGDLWLGHQNHRERVVSELHDYRIVQLSQSIYFADRARAEQADRILSEHPDFRVLIRDHLSLQRAADYLPRLDCRFCPDMALGYEPHPMVGIPRESDLVLAIARADKESASGLRDVGTDWLHPLRLRITDWGLHAKDPIEWRVARGVAWVQHKLVAVRRKLRVHSPLLPQVVVRKAIDTINRKNVRSALRLYAPAQAIVVDRLHAHVLAALLGTPHVLLDNNYRKLGAVFDDYTGGFSTARYCTELHEARERIREAAVA